MKKVIANFLVKILLKADDEKLSSLFYFLEKAHFKSQYSFFRKNYKIHKTFKFNGNDVLFYGDGEIHCGQNSYIGKGSTVQVEKDSKVVIGSNCSISHNVRIYTTTTVSDQDLIATENKLKKKGNVIIGDGVWIGANVFINPGVVIEDNVIIGANSVVTKNAVANGIYGGVPSKLIRMKN